ncbi:MAG: GAF domain-containing protein [Dehalococcoidia bacterium]|jgi:signal transduction protein with GAF and PtsI domain|nr:GAF domain-containing protein [Chloroflexota bacterium]MCK4242234.1 GAF domain-containing protein [Dehalococcoidia bacterium]
MIGKEAIRDSRRTRLMMDGPLEMILDSTLEATLQGSKVDGAEIYLLDEEKGELTYACHRGLSEACVKEAEATPVRLGEGIIGSVVFTGEPVFVADLHQAAGFFREIPKREGYCSFYSLPIKSADRVCGVWNLFFRTQQLSSRYLNWLAIPAEFIGEVLEYAEAVEESSRG